MTLFVLGVGIWNWNILSLKGWMFYKIDSNKISFPFCIEDNLIICHHSHQINRNKQGLNIFYNLRQNTWKYIIYWNTSLQVLKELKWDGNSVKYKMDMNCIQILGCKIDNSKNYSNWNGHIL